MPSADDLRRTLSRIDGRGYKAYKDIAGAYDFDDGLTLSIDHVQGDPFAAPSKLRLRVDQVHARIPPELSASRVRRIALQDYLTRQMHEAIRRAGSTRRGSGKSGVIAIDVGSQEVLERTAMVVNDEWVEARIEVGLPAAGRSVLGRAATMLLCDTLPALARDALCWGNTPVEKATAFVECIENTEAIRAQLADRRLVAFVADNAILPRASGASDRPLAAKDAVPFTSPQSLRITLTLPNAVDFGAGATTSITGMGIREGVTLIVGGGYHGKSTLLKAIERCVYPHVPGDGREYVVTRPDAAKIRAEDGRRVEQVDISPFISDLPFGRNTRAFSTDDASGSTSQAANIVEAIEVGTSTLLLDEDTSATNFMVRDARMQALVHKDDEPITPFLDRVREMYERHSVSTVLVMGGCGDYFDVADTVIMMRDYAPIEVTDQARRVAADHASGRQREVASTMLQSVARIPLAASFDASRGRRDVKIDAKGLGLILYGADPIELRGVEQLVDVSQTRAIGLAIHRATQAIMDDRATLTDVLDAIDRFFEGEGLDGLDPFHRPGRHPGNLARPRRHEIAAAINRLRTVRMRQQT